MHVDASNDAMAEGWNGSTGDFWTDNADLFDAGVAAYLAPLLAAAAVQPGEDVLDVGCGAGETTIQVARRGANATGVDLSARLLDLARRRAAREGVVCRFVQADAQVADLGVHDVLISRTGVMFFGDPPAAFVNLAGAVRPGGRIALAVWADYADQEWIRSFRSAAAPGREVPPPPPGAPHAFSLADPDHVRGLLARAGFADLRLDAVREPMFFGRDVAAAEQMALGLVGGMIDELDEAARAGARHALRASLQEHLGPDGVTYRSAMWIVTARVPA